MGKTLVKFSDGSPLLYVDSHWWLCVAGCLLAFS
jgi:hypothetical protein